MRPAVESEGVREAQEACTLPPEPPPSHLAVAERGEGREKHGEKRSPAASSAFEGREERREEGREEGRSAADVAQVKGRSAWIGWRHGRMQIPPD